MKQFIFLFFLVFFVLSCKKNEIEKPKKMQFKNYMEWWTYHNNYIKFYEEFDTKNTEDKTISKQNFLELLSSGNYVPVFLKNEKKITYKLQLLENEIDKNDIQSTIRQIALTEIYKLNWENKKFPKIEFKDINGNFYNNEFLQNKTVFLKTYFIKCQACNEELENLNKFANKNHNKFFLCLALDNENELINYLKEKKRMVSTYMLLIKKNSLKNN